MDLVNRKRQSTVEPSGLKRNSSSIRISNAEVKDEISDSHNETALGTSNYGDSGSYHKCKRAGSCVDRPWIEIQLNVEGVLSEGQVFNKYRSWMKDPSNYKSYGVSICGLS